MTSRTNTTAIGQQRMPALGRAGTGVGLGSRSCSCNSGCRGKGVTVGVSVGAMVGVAVGIMVGEGVMEGVRVAVGKPPPSADAGCRLPVIRNNIPRRMIRSITFNRADEVFTMATFLTALEQKFHFCYFTSIIPLCGRELGGLLPLSSSMGVPTALLLHRVG